MNDDRLKGFIARWWRDDIVPCLVDYIRIPNKSPAFDPDWAAHGHMDKAVSLLEGWARRALAPIAAATVEVVRLPSRTPVILIDIPGAGADCVLLYGHLDKQPEMAGWAAGKGPWAPVIEGDRLYGRGGADDGYAIFAALTAIAALHDQGIPHARAVVLIEACEESGSFDLPHYVDHLAPRIGVPSLVICLDSGCANYDQLWLTTSLRGLVGGTLSVRVLDEGVHSGDASGVVPSSFLVLRQLLSRLEDERTGAIRPVELFVPIPPNRSDEAQRAAAALGDAVLARFPFAAGVAPMSRDPVELLLNRAWRPQLAITGVDGLPPPENAGNVLLPYVSAKLSLRLPPTLDATRAAAVLRALFEQDPPFGACVSFEAKDAAAGWNAPAFAPWLARALERASQAEFGASAGFMGEGGSIPFMAMLGEKFPRAQFVVTGVLGPQSNAHGPNEFLHIPMAMRVTGAIARVLADHSAEALRGGA